MSTGFMRGASMGDVVSFGERLAELERQSALNMKAGLEASAGLLLTVERMDMLSAQLFLLTDTIAMMALAMSGDDASHGRVVSEMNIAAARLRFHPDSHHRDVRRKAEMLMLEALENETH